jgi:hypothetical protein
MRTRPPKKAPATANQQPVVAPQRTTAGEKQARAGALLAAAKRPRLTGTAQEAAERKGVEEGLWGTAPQTTTSLGGAHVVIIKGLLPDAEALLAEERDTWTHTDKKHHVIRDVPVSADDDSNGSGRQSLKVPASGPIAKALDERTAPIRERLGVRCVQRVGILSMAMSCRRQVLHYDYSDGQYTRWSKHEKKKSKKLRDKPPARYPWTLLVSLQPGGKLIIEKQGDGGGPVVIELGAGDAVLFRYDVKHGGASYTLKHMRLHEYWEPEGAGGIEFRVAVRYTGDHDGNQLHAVETAASWNKKSAVYNPGMVYAGAVQSYADVADPAKLIPGL